MGEWQHEPSDLRPSVRATAAITADTATETSANPTTTDTSANPTITGSVRTGRQSLRFEPVEKGSDRGQTRVRRRQVQSKNSTPHPFNARPAIPSGRLPAGVKDAAGSAGRVQLTFICSARWYTSFVQPDCGPGFCMEALRVLTYYMAPTGRGV
jgi:hypothetical protein